MADTMQYAAYLSPNGLIYICPLDEVGPGKIRLMYGDKQALFEVLTGSAEMSTFDIEGTPLNVWYVPAVCEAMEMTTRYMVAMLWLAKVAARNRDRGITFFINEASNPKLRRVTARYINKELH